MRKRKTPTSRAKASRQRPPASAAAAAMMKRSIPAGDLSLHLERMPRFPLHQLSGPPPPAPSRFQRKLLEVSEGYDALSSVDDGGEDVAVDKDCILSQDFFCTPDYITPEIPNNLNPNKVSTVFILVLVYVVFCYYFIRISIASSRRTLLAPNPLKNRLGAREIGKSRSGYRWQGKRIVGREIEQLKIEISDLHTQLSDVKSQISAIHKKMDVNFSSFEEMMKKLLEGQSKTTSSEAREASSNLGSGENSNLIRQREDQVETQKGKEKMPPLEPIPMGEPSRGYGEKHEEVEQERKCDDLERRGAEFERERGNYDQRGTASERHFLLMIKFVCLDSVYSSCILPSTNVQLHEEDAELKFNEFGSDDVGEKKQRYVSQSAVALRYRVMPPPCIRNPYLIENSSNTLDVFGDRIAKTARFSPSIGGDGISRYRTDFHEVEQIGSGNFSHVFKALKRIDGCLYAVKHSIKQFHNDMERKYALREVQALAALGYHANIVGYHTSWFENDKLYIQMEICDHSLSKGQIPRSGDVLEVLYQMATALNFIHDRGIAHMDVKPENIYVKHGVYKLGDFGCAILTDKSLPIEEGDSRYMPQEILNDKYEHLDKVDIFSLGAAIYELVKGSPLPESGPLFCNLREGKIPLLPGYSMQFQSVLKAMMDPDPLKRPSAREIMENPIFERVKKTTSRKE
ncbi:hypothetical protein M5K25_003356 [Dendrobium thyrsiflorum]|uniref:Wee1-like protein kinase n=1 Tax=Dendrobium thyrsiflorum TaxID=117978 RepID=A0ABD0VJ70_DENTH